MPNLTEGFLSRGTDINNARIRDFHRGDPFGCALDQRHPGFSILGTNQDDFRASCHFDRFGSRQKCVTVQFLAYDCRDWTVHAVTRGAKVVLLVRSLDADKVVNAAGFDAEAAYRRFLDSVELLPGD